MAWKDLPHHAESADALQRGLQRGRLAHAYLLSGSKIEDLEWFARTLGKAINCLNPPKVSSAGWGIDSCDQCISCRKIESFGHPDMYWLRAESKIRQIRTEQMNELLRSVHLKPNEARYKICYIVAADRLHTTAANKFLKTLEEPPADSIMMLISTAPEQVLETIRSRCQRIQLASDDTLPLDPDELAWLESFATAAARDQGGLLERYRLLGVLLKRLAETKTAIGEKLEKDSLLEKYDDIEPEFRKKLEDELTASIEAEYRRRRAEIIGLLQWWLRDIWLNTMQPEATVLRFPQLQQATSHIARRLDPERAVLNLEELEKTQRQLNTNVQEALALEVGLLKLQL